MYQYLQMVVSFQNTTHGLHNGTSVLSDIMKKNGITPTDVIDLTTIRELFIAADGEFSFLCDDVFGEVFRRTRVLP